MNLSLMLMSLALVILNYQNITCRNLMNNTENGSSLINSLIYSATDTPTKYQFKLKNNVPKKNYTLSKNVDNLEIDAILENGKIKFELVPVKIDDFDENRPYSELKINIGGKLLELKFPFMLNSVLTYHDEKQILEGITKEKRLILTVNTAGFVAVEGQMNQIPNIGKPDMVKSGNKYYLEMKFDGSELRDAKFELRFLTPVEMSTKQLLKLIGIVASCVVGVICLVVLIICVVHKKCWLSKMIEQKFLKKNNKKLAITAGNKHPTTTTRRREQGNVTDTETNAVTDEKTATSKVQTDTCNTPVKKASKMENLDDKKEEEMELYTCIDDEIEAGADVKIEKKIEKQQLIPDAKTPKIIKEDKTQASVEAVFLEKKKPPSSCPTTEETKGRTTTTGVSTTLEEIIQAEERRRKIVGKIE